MRRRRVCCRSPMPSRALASFGPCAWRAPAAARAKSTAGRDAVLSHVRQPDALWVARLARSRLRCRDGPPRPLYLRAPDAKLPAAKPADIAPLDPSAEAISRVWRAARRLVSPHPGTRKRSQRAARHAGHLRLLTRTTDSCWRARPRDEAEILTLAVTPTRGARVWARAGLQPPPGTRIVWARAACFWKSALDNPAALALYAGSGLSRSRQAQGLLRPRRRKIRRCLVLRSNLPLSPLGKSARHWLKSSP